MDITPERKKVVAFSIPYEAYGATIVVQKGNPERIHTLAQLKGKNVGVLETCGAQCKWAIAGRSAGVLAARTGRLLDR
jgi:accessory colonization factor AcfC